MMIVMMDPSIVIQILSPIGHHQKFQPISADVWGDGEIEIYSVCGCVSGLKMRLMKSELCSEKNNLISLSVKYTLFRFGLGLK